MLSKLRGIIIEHIPYSDNSLILKCYTDVWGMQSYMVSGIKGKKSAIKPSQLMPLTLVEMEVYHKQGKGLQRIKELKTWPVLNQVHFKIEKSVIAMFMAELIGKCLREEQQADEDLFSFLHTSIQILDLSEQSLANFPLLFMHQLTRYLGFYPKNNYELHLGEFSLMEGSFVSPGNLGADFIPESLGKSFHLLGQTAYEQMHALALTVNERRQLLSHLTRYYQLHVMMFGELKSPAVLQEVLNG